MKKLALIIVCYNSQSLIKDCLDSVYHYNDIGDELEVIIVDNNSKDQAAFLKSISDNYPNDIKLIPSKDNGGYGRGNNLGISHAIAPYVVVMNPDIRLVKPIFSEIIRVFEVQKRLAMGGVSFSDGSSSFYFKPEFYTVWNLIWFKRLVRNGRFNVNEMFLSGSFLAFRAEHFRDVGGFDEKIFLYNEESDITNRLLKAGYDIHWMRDLKVFHMTHSRRLNLDALKMELDSLEYYSNKLGFKPEKILNRYKRVNQFKYIIATLTRNYERKAFFRAWIDLINEIQIKRKIVF